LNPLELLRQPFEQGDDGHQVGQLAAAEPVAKRGRDLPGPRAPLALPTGEEVSAARERIRTLVESTDGFHISEMDLKLRGPGEFFGTRQSGELGFHVANPLRDRELLERARKEAFSLVEDPAQKESLQRMLGLLPPQWQRRYHLARIG